MTVCDKERGRIWSGGRPDDWLEEGEDTKIFQMVSSIFNSHIEADGDIRIDLVNAGDVGERMTLNIADRVCSRIMFD